MSRPSLIRRTAAEAFGTYALVTAGCGAIVVNATTGAIGHLGVALTFGLVVVVMVAGTGHLSGAHLNPAVTMAFASAHARPHSSGRHSTPCRPVPGRGLSSVDISSHPPKGDHHGQQGEGDLPVHRQFSA